VTELIPMRSTLEDVFVELVKTGTPPADVETVPEVVH